MHSPSVSLKSFNFHKIIGSDLSPKFWNQNFTYRWKFPLGCHKLSPFWHIQNPQHLLLILPNKSVLPSIVSFWGIGPKRRMIQEGCSSHSECNSGLLCHLWWEKKELLPRHHWVIFFKRVDKIESIKEPEPVPLASDVSEISACPPSVGDDPSALPSPAPLPPPGSNSSGLFTGCQPLYASCCTILLYFSRYWTLKVVIICLLLCIVWKVL